MTENDTALAGQAGHAASAAALKTAGPLLATSMTIGAAGAGRDQPASDRPAGPVLNGGATPVGNGSNKLYAGNMNGLGHAASNDSPLDASPELRRIVVASDHRGYAAKCRLIDHLRGDLPDHEVVDFGCNDGSRACDYPDYAIPAALLVAAGEYDAAVLLDGSGIGMGIAANKVRGIRAATCHDEITARIAREHNHCNALCVGVDLVGEKTLFRVVKTFLDTAFSGGRHVRRVAKLCAHEDESFAVEGEAALLRRAGG